MPVGRELGLFVRAKVGIIEGMSDGASLIARDDTLLKVTDASLILLTIASFSSTKVSNTFS